MSVMDLCLLQPCQGPANSLRVQTIDFQCLPALFDLLVCVNLEPESGLKTCTVSALLIKLCPLESPRHRHLTVELALGHSLCEHLSQTKGTRRDKRETRLVKNYQLPARQASGCKRSLDEQLKLPGKPVVAQKLPMCFLWIFMSSL